MKAIRIHEFGGPEVLKLEEIERPVPAADEILVRVFASGVNPVDWVIRNGANDNLRPSESWHVRGKLVLEVRKGN